MAYYIENTIFVNKTDEHGKEYGGIRTRFKRWFDTFEQAWKVLQNYREFDESVERAGYISDLCDLDEDWGYSYINERNEKVTYVLHNVKGVKD